MRNLTLPESHLLVPRHHGFTEYFDKPIVTGDRWTTIISDVGVISTPDAAGGLVRLVPSDGTVADNDEVYIHTTREQFLFADERPLEAIARIRWTEANVDDANVIWGLIDAWAADHLLDNGGGPVASYSGAVFFKADGDTVWSFETSLAGAQTTTVLAALTPDGAADFHSLKITVHSRNATEVIIVPWIDENGGQDFKIALDANGNKIQHVITLGAPTEMALGFGAKNGAANNESVEASYMSCWQQTSAV